MPVFQIVPHPVYFGTGEFTFIKSKNKIIADIKIIPRLLKMAEECQGVVIKGDRLQLPEEKDIVISERQQEKPVSKDLTLEGRE